MMTKVMLGIGLHFGATIAYYSKCSKISNTFLFLLSNKMLVIMAGIYIMLVILANKEEPHQTVSSEAVWSGSALFVKTFLTFESLNIYWIYITMYI